MLVFSEVIKNAYEKWKDKDFVFEKVDGEWKGTTFGKLIEDADILAHKLIDEGFKDKNILIFSRNCTDYFVADLAITAYVGACANINCQLPADSVERIINKAEISAVFYEEIFEPMFTEISKNHPDLKLYPLHKTVAELGQPGELFNFPEKDPEACSKIIFTRRHALRAQHLRRLGIPPAPHAVHERRSSLLLPPNASHLRQHLQLPLFAHWQHSAIPL